MTKPIQIFLMILVLAVGIFAQFDPVDPPNTGMTFNGEETSVGTYYKMADMTGGNSYLLTSSNETYSSVLFTISLDYIGQPAFDDRNTIVGGNWNMAFYDADGTYRGAIFGGVVKGEISWIFQSPEKQTSANLLITGGTGDFETRTGSNTFTMNATTTLENQSAKVGTSGLELQ